MVAAQNSQWVCPPSSGDDRHPCVGSSGSRSNCGYSRNFFSTWNGAFANRTPSLAERSANLPGPLQRRHTARNQYAAPSSSATVRCQSSQRPTGPFWRGLRIRGEVGEVRDECIRSFHASEQLGGARENDLGVAISTAPVGSGHVVGSMMFCCVAFDYVHAAQWKGIKSWV